MLPSRNKMMPEFGKKPNSCFSDLKIGQNGFTILKVNFKLLRNLHASQMESYDVNLLINSDCSETSWSKISALLSGFVLCFLSNGLHRKVCHITKGCLCREVVYAEMLFVSSTSGSTGALKFYMQSLKRCDSLQEGDSQHHAIMIPLLWRHLLPLIGCTGSLLLSEGSLTTRLLFSGMGSI